VHIHVNLTHKTLAYFQRIEPLLFAVLAFFNLYFILNLDYFPSIDGPAHLYNARLINEIIFQNNSFIYESININPYPVPNWICHALMALLLQVFEAPMAEKSIVISYLILLPYSFRYLIKIIQPENSLLAILILPFTFNFLMVFGFFNFSFAIILYFYTLGIWIKAQQKQRKLSVFVLAILFFLIYFSHLFIFLFLILSIFFIEAISYFQKAQYSPKFTVIQRIKPLLLSAIIPFAFMAIYATVETKEKIYSFVDSPTLMLWIVEIRPLVIFNHELESKFIYPFILCLLLLTILKIISFLGKNNQPNLRENKTSIFWGLISSLILILYFVLPDSNRLVGFFSIRLLLLFYLLIIIWLLSQPIRIGFQIAIFLVVFGITQYRNRYLNDVFVELNKEICFLKEMSKHILPNTVVLTLNYTENWLTPHYTNYLGIDKPMIILDNYEIETPFFPLIWNENTIPNFRLDTLQSRINPCIKWMSNTTNSTSVIDYVYLHGHESSITSSCEKDVWQHVLKGYTPIYENSNGKLYQLIKL